MRTWCILRCRWKAAPFSHCFIPAELMRRSMVISSK
uniref:Uncharacterized protein n=1 Tax=Anguilla anguilla TaxID=7936 RepID=A0A0E9VCW7_ANGAN